MMRVSTAPALSVRQDPVHPRRHPWWAGVIFLLLAMVGCGVSQNPSRVGNLPNGNIIRTHGKPPLWGYWRDFDPNAKSLTVTPKTAINQVGTQHVIVASVCDADGNGRRSRRVEWHVEGAGYIVEVDESGLFPGRGYLVDDKYAVSYTNYQKQTITRGNKDKRDDIELRPGQTYCVIFSPVEGETHVTCYAPGIHDWQKHKVTVTKYWVDAQPIFPPPAINRAGEPHTFGTRVVRSSDQTGASGYRVRYRVLDGPPAVFAGGNSPAVEVITDSVGNGGAVLQQLQPTPGVNRIQIDVVRPADSPTGREILLSSHITTKTWVAPQISIQKIAPPAVALGSQIPYRIIVTNTGSVATSGLTIRDTIPPSLNLIGSNPPASLQGNTLIWTFGPLPPAQAVAVEFACQATQGGVVANNCAEAGTPDGLRAEACASTQVIAGSLVVDKRGPEVSIVGAPVNFEIAVSNPGTAPVLNVRLIDEFDPGLSHTSGQNALQLPVGNVGPGETKIVPLTLTATVAGRLCNRVRAEGEGGIVAQDEHCIEVSQPQLSIRKTGPRGALIGKEVPFEITVRNTGNAPAQNVLVRDQLPVNLQPLSVAGQGAVQGQSALWNLGILGPGEERKLGLIARAIAAGDNICNTAELSATGVGNLASDPVCLNIRGVAGMLTELIDRADPVPIGGETTYTIRVTNQGSTPLNNVTVGCVIPPEMEYVDSEGHPATVPAQYDPRSRVLRFKPFNGEDGKTGMAPSGGWLVFQVQVKAVRKGDARFELNVIADQIKTPVVDQESTQCFDPNTGASDGAILMPKPDAEVLIPASSQDVPIPSVSRETQKDDSSADLVPLELPTISIQPTTPTAPTLAPAASK
ncbi:DUF11 domain-containing protein [bacterium]|nr:DUF11 domain-containing protein [bacterium]